MKKMKLAVIILTLALFTGGAAYAQMDCAGKQGDNKHMGRMFRELNLTSEQQQKLEDNRKAQREGMMKLRASIKEKYAQLQKDLKDQAVTKAAVTPLVNEIKSLQAQLVDNRINGIFAVKEILTPEQFAKFQQQAGQMKERMKSRFKERQSKRKCAYPGQEQVKGDDAAVETQGQ